MELKRVGVSLLIGVAVTELVAYLGQAPGRHWFDSILWYGYLADALVSGNMHSPNGFVAWLAVCLGVAALSYGTATLVALLRARRAAGKERS